MKLGGSMTEIFSVGLQKTDKGMKTKLNLFYVILTYIISLKSSQLYLPQYPSGHF